MKSLRLFLLLGGAVLLPALAQPPAAPPEAAPPPAPAAPDAPPAEPAPAPAVAPVPPEAPGEAAPAPAPAPMRRLDVERGNPPFGDTVVSEGSRRRNVFTLMGSSIVNGHVTEDVVSIVGDTVISEGVDVGGGAVAVLGTLETRGRVRQHAVGVLGDVVIDGPVRGNAVAVLGDMKLGPNAVVNGNLVVVGGLLEKDPRAIVRGNEVPLSHLMDFGGWEWLATWVQRCLLYGRPLDFEDDLDWAWGIALGFLGFYVLLSLLFSRSVEQCAIALETRPGSSLLATALTFLLTPLILVLLAVTIVGALFVPFLLLGLFLAMLFGKAAMLVWMGRRFTRFFGNGPLGHPAVAAVVGGSVVLLLYVVPILGFLAFALLTWLGLGVVIHVLLLSSKRESAHAVAQAASAPSVPAPAAYAAAGVVGGPPAYIPAIPAPDTPVADVPPTTLPRAGFMLRLGAMALDTILVSGALILLAPSAPFWLSLTVFSLAVYAAILWRLKGTTIGGIICGLQVVRLDGRELDWVTAVVRALGCFLSLVVAGLGFIWVAFDDERQSWHDKIAGTTVVRLPKAKPLV